MLTPKSIHGFRIGACMVNVFPVKTAAVLNKNTFLNQSLFLQIRSYENA